MTDRRDLTGLFDRATELAEHGLHWDSVDDCGAVDQLVREVDAYARNRVHHLLRSDLNRIADKLEMGVALTPAEERTIETVVIGSAIGYIDVENNVAEWKSELVRLLGELRLAASRDDIDGLLRLRGLCRDALNVLTDLLIFMREKERIARFREGASNPDPERGRAIARFIRESMDSELH